jgi:hypothetical protein
MGSMEIFLEKQGYGESPGLSSEWEVSPDYPPPSGAIPFLLEVGKYREMAKDVRPTVNSIEGKCYSKNNITVFSPSSGTDEGFASPRGNREKLRGRYALP